MQKGFKNVSLMVGGGQDYYGPTAARDKLVVKDLASHLYAYAKDKHGLDIQIITGGTAGIPDEFAAAYKGRTLDIVSSEYLDKYKERTADNPRPYWVAGKTQEQRRLAFATNPDIRCALFIQGGQYTTHEIQIFLENGREIVPFRGSGGASGGKIAYKNWRLPESDYDKEWASDSTDPDTSDDKVRDIVDSLLEQICNKLSC